MLDKFGLDEAQKRILALPKIECGVEKMRGAKNGLKIQSSALDSKTFDEILDIAKALKPWRKGGFELFGEFIDSEWVSAIKYDLIAPTLREILQSHTPNSTIKIADIGCNNGYYAFELARDCKAWNRRVEIIGFDPSRLFFLQFLLLENFIKSGVKFEQKGVESLLDFGTKFDLILCLGVIYHRYDPISMLKTLKQSLAKNGSALLDSFIIESSEELVLSPAVSYLGMSNAYFIPSVSALKGWAKRAGFSKCELFATRKASTKEQRKTDWIDGKSLGDFLINGKSIEGYKTPTRGYFLLQI